MMMMMVRVGLLLLGLAVRVHSQGIDLGGGILTRTDVERYADISLDIRDIREFVAANSGDAALDRYTQGHNANLQTGVKFTVQKMTTELKKLARTAQTPNYLYHLYGLADRDSTNLDQSYADSFALTNIRPGSKIAADALVALHSWMYATHVLLHGVDICHKLTIADNPDLFTLGGGGMDEFIALWIGKDQTVGSSDGHGLYALTQKAAELFNTVDTQRPEAPANTNLKLLYQSGAVTLALPNSCTRGNDESVQILWTTAQHMISQMYVPLVQLLIDALYRLDAQAISLYALAVVPQTVQCRPSVYKKLKEELLDGTVSSNKVSEIVQDLQSIYECLGISCNDVGAYKIDRVPACLDPALNAPLAEYTPSTLVRSHSKIDLDILQLKILTKLEAYNYAKHLYSFGRNSEIRRETDNDYIRTRSLKEMATTNERQAAVPFYTEFVQYHNDPNYANTEIEAVLNGVGKWAAASPEQKMEVVVKTCSYRILYMYALAELAGAVQECKQGESAQGLGGAHPWDEVAAFLIGSLEGAGPGGSSDLEDGQLMWNLANRRAFQFQTLNSEGYSLINSELEDLLFAGKGEIDAYDCDNLVRTVDRIQHLLLLPVIQSTLRYAIINRDLSTDSPAGDLAQGEIFALSVLPIVKRYDDNAASLIQENMVVIPDSVMVANGPQAVANAFYNALDEFGYSCDLVGATAQADACEVAGGLGAVRPPAGGASSGNSRAVTAAALGSIGFALQLLW